VQQQQQQRQQGTIISTGNNRWSLTDRMMIAVTQKPNRQTQVLGECQDI
jgi:hypothetical protein